MSTKSKQPELPGGSRIKAKLLVWGSTLIFAFLFFVFIFAKLQQSYSYRNNDRYRSFGFGGYGRKYDLKMIAVGLIQYVDVLGDGRWYPPSIWDLHPKIFGDPAIFTGASDVGAEDADGWVHEYHYLYQGGVLEKDVPIDAPVIIYPFEDGGEIRYSVSFGDGHVERMSEENFLELWEFWEKWKKP